MAEGTDNIGGWDLVHILSIQHYQSEGVFIFLQTHQPTPNLSLHEVNNFANV